MNIIFLVFLGIFIIPVLLVLMSFHSMATTWSQQIADQLAAEILNRATGYQPAPQAAYTPPPAAAFTPPPPSPASSAQPASSGHEALRRLKELHDLGVLTDAEFNAKKAEILSRL